MSQILHSLMEQEFLMNLWEFFFAEVLANWGHSLHAGSSCQCTL